MGLALKRRLDVGLDTTKNKGETRVRPGWQDEGGGRGKVAEGPAHGRPLGKGMDGSFIYLTEICFAFYHVPHSMNRGETQPAVGRTGSVFTHLTRAQQLTCSLLGEK